MKQKYNLINTISQIQWVGWLSIWTNYSLVKLAQEGIWRKRFWKYRRI